MVHQSTLEGILPPTFFKKFFHSRGHATRSSQDTPEENLHRDGSQGIHSHYHQSAYPHRRGFTALAGFKNFFIEGVA